jgi:hypothetical protein
VLHESVHHKLDKLLFGRELLCDQQGVRDVEFGFHTMLSVSDGDAPVATNVSEDPAPPSILLCHDTPKSDILHVYFSRLENWR